MNKDLKFLAVLFSLTATGIYLGYELSHNPKGIVRTSFERLAGNKTEELGKTDSTQEGCSTIKQKTNDSFRL